MDYYWCERCGIRFDEFEMNFLAAQQDQKTLCQKCRTGKEPEKKNYYDYSTEQNEDEF
jgi:hypothetical protein